MVRLKPFEIDVLLFDLDGTLVDSLPDINASVNEVMRNLKLPEIPQADVRQFVGDGVRVLLERCLRKGANYTSSMLDEALLSYHRHHETQCTIHVKPYPHVGEILKHFASKRKAVITNKPSAYSAKILKHLKLDSHFEILLGGDSLPQRKPHPGPVCHILDIWRCPAHRAIMIGDGLQDVTAGKAAGVRTCAVRSGFGKAEGLNGADFVIDDLIELKERLI